MSYIGKSNLEKNTTSAPTVAIETDPAPVVTRMTFKHDPGKQNFTPVIQNQSEEKEIKITAVKSEKEFTDGELQNPNGVKESLNLPAAFKAEVVASPKKDAGANALPKTPSSASLHRVASR